MEDKKILTIQDISCYGQCSITVALPIISACGFETAIIPSAVLSTHTGGFKNFTFHDLTEDIPLIQKHWQDEKIFYDAIYTGYLGSIKQIEYMKNIMNTLLKKDGLKIVDPVMGDDGKLYSIFDMNFVNEMKKLCAIADIIIPNITEACFLTGMEYKEKYDENYILTLVKKLQEFNKNLTIILTGVSYKEGKIGVVVYEKEKISYYEHKKIEKGCHGTGDVYSSAFVGALMNKKSLFDSAKIAADYVVMCIEKTKKDESHWYGVKFEGLLGELIKMVKS